MTDKEAMLTLEELCRQILDFAWNGDYSSGNEAFGIDEGRTLAKDRLDEFEAQLAKADKDRLDSTKLREKIDLEVLSGTHRVILAAKRDYDDEPIDAYLTSASINKIIDKIIPLIEGGKDSATYKY